MTLKGKVDLAVYHPRYVGFKPRTLEDLNEQLDMGWVFYPPEGEEWYKPMQNDGGEIKTKSSSSVTSSKSTVAAEDPFRTSSMRPYLSPMREVRKVQPKPQENLRWGSYKGKTSYDESHKSKKTEALSRDISGINTTVAAIPIQSQLRSESAPPRPTPMSTPEVLPSTYLPRATPADM